MPRPTQVPAGRPHHFAYGAFTLCGRPSQCRSAMMWLCNSTIAGPTTPDAVRLVWATPRSLAATQGISRLISSPPGTEMVQFPGSRFMKLCIHSMMTGLSSSRVTPFGNPRIKGCLLLPVAFRSLPRPSSPDSSEASSMNSFSLDHILSLPLSLE